MLRQKGGIHVRKYRKICGWMLALLLALPLSGCGGTEPAPEDGEIPSPGVVLLPCTSSGYGRPALSGNGRI